MTTTTRTAMTDPLLASLTEPLGDPLVRHALIEVGLIGLLGGCLGCWIIEYGLPYAAESVAHCMLPGLVGAALIGAPLLAGGAMGLLAGAAAIALATRVPSIERDTAVAVAVTALFGLGALMALSPDSPPGIRNLLFGDVLAVSTGDLALAAGLTALTIGALAAIHPRLLAAAFDPGAARGLGVDPRRAQAVLLVLLALAVLVTVQGLGNLLAVASLVGPAAVARPLATRMSSMMLLACAIAIASGFAGLYASYFLDLAAGASVAAATVLVCLVVRLASAVGVNRIPRPAASAS
jgi:ABC-type Mn2+/Zn2+ transport system permease subunit